MTTSAFRHHDDVPPGMTSAYYAQLIREWVELNRSPRAAATIRAWGSAEPALAGCSRPGDVVDTIDASPTDRKDEMLLALIRLTQDGHQLAGRVTLQAMLPKLGRMTRHSSPNTSDDAWIEDRRHIAVAQMWHVISTYPTETRPRKVAANLALDTLHRITEGTRALAREVPVDPAELVDLLGPVVDEPVVIGELGPDADLPTMLGWAVGKRLLTPEEAELLTSVYVRDGAPGAGSQDAARHLGLTPAAVRQRCSRARARLTAGLQAEREQIRAV